MSELLFKGVILPNKVKKVFCNDVEMHPLLTRSNHSPTGYEWGYFGSGPSQLAFDILFVYCIRFHLYTTEIASSVAHRYSQTFKEKVIGRIPVDEEFSLTSTQIKEFLEKENFNYGEPVVG